MFQKIMDNGEYSTEGANSPTLSLYKGQGGQGGHLAKVARWPIPWAKAINTRNEDRERLLLKRLQLVVKIRSHQCGFTSGKSTSEAISSIDNY